MDCRKYTAYWLSNSVKSNGWSNEREVSEVREISTDYSVACREILCKGSEGGLMGRAPSGGW